ncbi:uncharacterized protein CCOS01_16424 [Colletotrichum costaricense]|uniref:G domain-containing protein n=1 Tax=Colletotrichum costaricense TaxID=1209916 RepID=A0AAI9YFM7_9PEZI|nr:uncharacterized protein CCOS01_16424 [Colletotrichum costaricense]KAK1506565.1 hypothetical protein CCOS01_16424 [Colletotrichum costaricense]
MSSRLRRIVACVDETGRSEDSQEGERPWRLKPPKGKLHAISGRGSGNYSSLFRIYAFLKNGKNTDEKGNKVEQSGPPSMSSSEEVDTPDVSRIEPGRHAHAMNEERKHFPVLRSEPVDNSGHRGQEDCHQQAGLVGTRDDMCGGAVHDGLSLLPLQWMLIESRSQGVVSKHDPPRHLKGRTTARFNIQIRGHLPIFSTGCRILSCGNAGVGKSTLLNRDFGITMVNTWNHGHDSEGFQAGNLKESECVQGVSGQKIRPDAGRGELSRNMAALARALEEVASTAPLVPIIIVGTEKDKFLLPHRYDQTRYEHHFDINDEDSIKGLISMATASFHEIVVSEAICAAHIPDIEAKIDQAIEKTLRLLRTAVPAARILGAGTFVATPTVSRCLCQNSRMVAPVYQRQEWLRLASF